jgi:methylenetetrahydrofolate reductase (NADPH)
MPGTRPGTSPDALLAGCSLGVTWKELGDLEQARAVIPPGTRINVGFRDTADMAMRVSTARAIRRAGFFPVPIIAARRLLSEEMLRQYLAELRAADASGSVLVVGGDPDPPRGPYADAASVIRSGLLEHHGVREAGVAGHPGGHPAVTDGALWQALAGKAAALEQRGLNGSVVTQFGFDPDVVLTWLAEVRARGVSVPVWVGVPGPAGVRQLLRYASVCGVGVSAPVAREYGFSLDDPIGEAGPDRFIRALAASYDARLHGEVKLHFNTFGGFAATTAWISRFRGRIAGHADANGDGLPGASARARAGAGLRRGRRLRLVAFQRGSFSWPVPAATAVREPGRAAAAGIELRITPSIWPFWRRVAHSTVEFSGSRLRNSAPHPDRFQ